MEYFLTYEDRMALLDRARDDTNGEGLYDYYGQLIELALMYPKTLEELKKERNNDIEPDSKSINLINNQEIKPEQANPKILNFLKIVK